MCALKVGELAKRTGLTIRTLHHYDEIGLLRPSHHTESGHRLYSAADVARLQQIVSLRQLGFSLEEIRACLEQPGFSPIEVIELHLHRLRQLMAQQRKLYARLEALAKSFRSAEAVSTDDFLLTLEAMSMMEKYYTPEQLQQLEQRRQAVGEARIQEVQQEWSDFFAAVQEAIDAGVDPSDGRAHDLARKWLALIQEFTGGDPGLFQSLQNLYSNESQVGGMQVASMQPMMDFIQKAAASAGIQHP